MVLRSGDSIWKLLRRENVLSCEIKVINSYSASHDNWCTETLLNGNYSTVRGDGESRVDEVRASTTSPMPEHKGFMLQ